MSKLTIQDLQDFGIENDSDGRNLFRMIQSIPESTIPNDVTVSVTLSLLQSLQKHASVSSDDTPV